MNDLANRLRGLRFNADLRIEIAGRCVALRARGTQFVVEVPDAATGFALWRAELPAGLSYRHVLAVISSLGASAQFRIRGRTVAYLPSDPEPKSSRPTLRWRPLSLSLALLGR